MRIKPNSKTGSLYNRYYGRNELYDGILYGLSIT